MQPRSAAGGKEIDLAAPELGNGSRCLVEHDRETLAGNDDLRAAILQLERFHLLRDRGDGGRLDRQLELHRGHFVSGFGPQLTLRQLERDAQVVFRPWLGRELLEGGGDDLLRARGDV